MLPLSITLPCVMFKDSNSLPQSTSRFHARHCIFMTPYHHGKEGISTDNTVLTWYLITQTKNCFYLSKNLKCSFVRKKISGPKPKTINSRDSLVVTHPTTGLPAQWLSTAERTGSPVFIVLWSIARGFGGWVVYITLCRCEERKNTG